jgi:hypothetical protein
MQFSHLHVCYMIYQYPSPWIDHSSTQYTKMLYCIQPCIKKAHQMDYENEYKRLITHFLFVHDNSQMTIKLSCAHKHKTLTMLSLRLGNISSALCSTTFGTLFASECRIFCSLKLDYHSWCFVGCKRICVEEPLWYWTLFLIHVLVSN